MYVNYCKGKKNKFEQQAFFLHIYLIGSPILVWKKGISLLLSLWRSFLKSNVGYIFRMRQK